ncbi:MAG: hypothetical protein HY663_04810 [Chloroflexi bacterium]|nr:hypothetical protein [Chloroflexota bacterium]
MAEIFDLSKIKRLVEEKRYPAILIVDTNVLMNEPDFSKWGISVGRAIFVLPEMLHIELEHLKTKPEPTKEKAIKAITSVNNLFKQGKITDGIAIEGIGSFISISTPKANQLDPELEQLGDIVKAFHRSDAKFLLLTRECNQFIPNIPTLFVTSEYNLFNIMEANGIPSHMFESFPISGIEEVIKDSLRKPIDWDKELADMQVATKQNSIVVEATLTDYKSAPNFLDKCPPIIAEGYGTVYDGNNPRSFLWTIPFYPENIISSPKSSEKTTLDPQLGYPIYLDFLWGDEPKQDIFDGIADRLLDCTGPSFEEGKPTLQNPESVMERLLYFEYITREDVSEEALEKLRQEIEEAEGLIHYWTDWILNSEVDEDEQAACLEGFIQAVKDCWKIGRTYKFSFIP